MRGWHGRVGAIDRLDALKLSASDSRLEWVRDAVDTNAFRVKMPPGSHTLDLQFDYRALTSSDAGDLNLFAERPEALDVQPAELERSCCP